MSLESRSPLSDGLSAAQCSRLHARVADQAAAERAVDIAYLSPAQQCVWSLVNKGAAFVACMEHDAEAGQAGAVIARLLEETLGAGWSHFSVLANISYPGSAGRRISGSPSAPRFWPPPARPS